MNDAFEQIASQACVELFAGFGVSVSPPRQSRVGGPPSSLRFDDATTTGCAIDIMGSQIRGSFVLASSFDLIARSRPPHGHAAKLSAASAADWLYVRDWTKELGNQLVGRIKNRLWSRGYSVSASMPTILSGAAAAGRLRSSSRQPLTFSSAGGEIFVLLDLTVPPGAEPHATAPTEAPQREGEVVLF